MNAQQRVDMIKTWAKRGAQIQWLAFKATQPFLNIFGISAIADYYANKYIDQLIDKGEMQALFKYIDVRTSKQGVAFESAAYNYAAVKMNGTPEQIMKAEKDLDEKFYAFARLNT